MNMKFGDYFKALRLKAGMTLREFCVKHSFDAGNISKLERGVFAAPQSEEILNNYAKALKIKKGSDEYLKFFDLAMASKLGAQILHNIEDDELLNMLPVLFRTIDNKDITQEKLQRIINIVKKELNNG